MHSANINPFHLSADVLGHTKPMLKDHFDEFTAEYFYQWALFVFIGEYTSTIVYPKLKGSLLEKFQNTISEDNVQKIKLYFDAIVHDETEHTDLLLKILKNWCEYVPTEELFKISGDSAVEYFNKESTVDTLSRYYIGECYLWVGFYKLYRETTNTELKKILHRLLVDESNHNHSLYKIFKSIVPESEFDLDYFNSRVKDLRYFGFPFVKSKLGLPDSNTKKDSWWITLLFDSEWHRKFNELVIKKCHRVVQLYYPEIDLANYKKIINN